jgi:hypothetical protein
MAFKLRNKDALRSKNQNIMILYQTVSTTVGTVQYLLLTATPVSRPTPTFITLRKVATYVAFYIEENTVNQGYLNI